MGLFQIHKFPAYMMNNGFRRQLIHLCCENSSHGQVLRCQLPLLSPNRHKQIG